LFDGGDDETRAPDYFEEVPDDPVSEAQARSSRAGKEFDHEAFAFLERLGAHIEQTYIRVFGYTMDALVVGQNGSRFYVDAHGTPDRTDRPQAGMRRTDTMLKFGFKALRLHQRGCPHPLLLLTSHMPAADTQSAYFLSELNEVLFDAVGTSGDFAGARRLAAYFTEEPAPSEPFPAEWRAVQLPLDFDFVIDEDSDA
jgi:hypothetical protein